MFANITFWVIKLFVAGFVIRVIPGHGELKHILMSFRSVVDRFPKYVMKKNYLMVVYWQITRMTPKTFRVPNSSHTTEKSSMANLSIASSTYPTAIVRFNVFFPHNVTDHKEKYPFFIWL